MIIGQDSGIDANSQSSESSSAKSKIIEEPVKEPEVEPKKTITKATKKNKKNKSPETEVKPKQQQEVNGDQQQQQQAPSPLTLMTASTPIATPTPSTSDIRNSMMAMSLSSITPNAAPANNNATNNTTTQNTNKKSRPNKQTSPSTGPAKKKAPNVGTGSGSAIPTSGASGTGNAPAAPPPDAGWKEVVRKSKKVIVPANAISRVIGRGGCNINAVREMSGAHIEVEKLQGKASHNQQPERTILIKGSAEATRQANTWIQQIINSPDKDMQDILGKNYLSTKALQQSTTIQSTVIVNSKVSSGKLTPTPTVTPAVIPITSVKSTKTTLTTTTSSIGTKTSTSLAKPKPSSTFAAVASGESFGMIQTGGTHPGSLAKVQKAKSPDIMTAAASTMDETFGTFEAPTKVEAKANLDNKDYSPFKSYAANWQDDKNFAAVTATGMCLN